MHQGKVTREGEEREVDTGTVGGRGGGMRVETGREREEREVDTGKVGGRGGGMRGGHKKGITRRLEVAEKDSSPVRWEVTKRKEDPNRVKQRPTPPLVLMALTIRVA